jgi:hypothetical protein
MNSDTTSAIAVATADSPASKRKIISVDFDGVLHSYASGWRGAACIPDPPVPGAIEWLTSVVDDGRFKVAIFSSRSGQPGGCAAMRVWLLEHGMREDAVEQLSWPTEKPPAHIMVDDRAVCFRGFYPGRDEMHDFVPWWKKQFSADVPVARPEDTLVSSRSRADAVTWGVATLARSATIPTAGFGDAMSVEDVLHKVFSAGVRAGVERYGVPMQTPATMGDE